MGKGLDGERIGLEEIGDGLWRVWFSFYELGRFDEREGRLLPRPEPVGEDGSSGEGPDSGRPRAPSAPPRTKSVTYVLGLNCYLSPGLLIRASRPALHAPPTDSGEPVTLKEKNSMLLYFKHLHPSAPAKRPEKSGRSCYNADRKSSGTSTSAVAQRQVQSRRGEPGTTKGDDESGESGQTRSGARLQTCRVAIRLSCPRASDFAGDISLQHVFAAWSKVPASLPPQPLRRC